MYQCTQDVNFMHGQELQLMFGSLDKMVKYAKVRFILSELYVA